MTDSLSHLKDTLRRADHRITRPREIIFEVLNSHTRPLAPKEIFDHLKREGLSQADLASIYRSLTLFLDLKLVHKLADGRYTICRHQEQSLRNHAHPQHAHVHTLSQCTQCGKSFEIKAHTAEVCQMTNQILRQMKDTINVSTIMLQGICIRCDLKRSRHSN